MLRKGLGSVAVAMVLMLGVLALSASSVAHAADTAAGRIQVTGVGMVELSPDQATIIFRISQLRDSAADAQRANAETLRAIEEVLKSLGISEDQLKTQSVSLREEWEYRTNERVFTGYRAEQVLAVTTAELDQIGPIMDAVVSVPGAAIDGVNFGLRDRREAEKLALQEAYAHAASRARVLAEMAGITLGVPSSIVDQTSVQAALPLRMEQSVAKLAAYDASTPVFAGTISVEARVYLEFQY